MKINNIFKISYSNIKNNRLRSFLTMLGLVVGIASVIILVGIGEGSTNAALDEVSNLGSDILTMNITDSEYSIDYDEFNKFYNADGIELVTPYKMVNAQVSRNNETSSNTSVIATDQNYLKITNNELSNGRNISIIDVENKSKVCLIGSSAAEEYFYLADPVGETIKINGDNYTIIGLLEESGSTLSSIDNSIVIPLTTASYLGVDKEISSIYMKISNTDNIDMTTTYLENFIRENFSISSDYFTLVSATVILDAIGSITNTLSLLLGGIASISLVVGGIGVMNVMLVSVSERTREIGIRKSLGAKRSDILKQFLVEALILCLIGGVFGILVGILLGNVASLFGLSFTTSAFMICLSSGVSLLIGIIFGIFPAYKASKLNPIDALRSE